MIIKKGNYANADLILYGMRIKKTFIRKPWWIRHTIGRAFILREYEFYRNLSSITSLNKHCHRSRYSLTLDYIPGTSLENHASKGFKVPESSMIAFEETIYAIHKLGYVHLDLRNANNVLIDENAQLHIIDFQSGMKIHKWYPKFLKNFMCAMDLTAVGKFWDRVCDTPLSPERRAYLEKYNRYRKIWIFKGYPLRNFLKRFKHK